MDDILTMKAIDGLMLLMNAPPIKKKKQQRKTLIKEKRAENLKAWHQMRRNAKEREAIKHRNRSNAMKATWAKRKAISTN
jgi:hypothetical protein